MYGYTGPKNRDDSQIVAYLVAEAMQVGPTCGIGTVDHEILDLPPVGLFFSCHIARLHGEQDIVARRRAAKSPWDFVLQVRIFHSYRNEV